MRKMFLTLLLCSSIYGNAWADVTAAENVVLPLNGHFSLIEEHDREPGAYFFEGSVKLRGQLEVGWVIDGVLENGEIVHYLQMHFIPEQNELASLPHLKQGGYNINADMIIINSENIEESVRRYFPDVSEHFFNNKESVLSMPVQAVIDAYGTYADGNCQYFSARFVNVETLNEPLGDLAKKQCSVLNFAKDMLITKSSDGYVNLRSDASSSSEILQQLPNNTFLAKMETRGNWFLVTWVDAPEVRGFVHKSQVVGAQ